MAFITCEFYSEVLGVGASMNVILPQTSGSQIGIKGVSNSKLHPTLYLLHGWSDNHTMWTRMTSIERYAARLGIAVVMPAVNRSFYTDMNHGYKYWTFISEELPKLARSFFPLSTEKKDNFVAGLSMGGYGAMKLGLSFPERYAAVGSFSGALDINRLVLTGELGEDVDLIFAPPNGPKGTDDDLFALLERYAVTKVEKPMLYMCCGTEDFLYEDNQTFRKLCEKLKVPVVYEEEKGDHEWGYWDMKIQSFLAKLPL